MAGWCVRRRNHRSHSRMRFPDFFDRCLVDRYRAEANLSPLVPEAAEVVDIAYGDLDFLGVRHDRVPEGCAVG